MPKGIDSKGLEAFDSLENVEYFMGGETNLRGLMRRTSREICFFFGP